MWSGPSISVDKSEDADEDEDMLEDDTDKVRIAAFLSVRKVAMGSDESLLDMVLKVGFRFFILFLGLPLLRRTLICTDRGHT